MSFIYPLGFLGLIAVPIVIIIYLLRSRYKTKTVSSTFIWKRSLKYVKRRIPLNFIMSMLLVLQILIVVAATLAITRPTVEPFKTEEQVIILDASASMLAVDGDTTRFEAAKKKIEEAAEEIGDNHKMTLILAGEEPLVIGKSRMSDKGEFLTALRPLECTLKSSNITKALELAADVLNQNNGAQVLVYTDKTYIDTDGIVIVDCKREAEWNAGVISFDVEDYKTGSEFITNVGCYGQPGEFSVKLLVNDKVVAQRNVKLGAGGVTQLRFTHSQTTDTGVDEIRVRLNEPILSYNKATVELSATDSFEFDDSMTVYPKEKKTPKILYVSKYVTVEGGKKTASKSVLNFALKANGYSIESDDMYNSINEIGELKGYDIYIFEGITPYYLPTDGAVWLIDAENAFAEETGLVVGNRSPINDEEGYRITKAVNANATIVKNVHIDIPLMYGGQEAPAALTVYRAITTASNSAFSTVYKANDQDVFVAGRYKSVPMIVTGFDFSNSSLIAYISDFPMLVKNMISYSVPELITERTAAVGSQVSIEFPVGAKTISRYYEGKLENKIDVAKYIIELENKAKEDPEFVIADHLKEVFEITSPGKYEIVVTYPDGEDRDLLDDEKRYAITGHLSHEETSITERVPSESLKYPQVVAVAEDKAQVEIFPYVIAVLILLLIIEWGVYYREQY